MITTSITLAEPSAVTASVVVSVVMVSYHTGPVLFQAIDAVMAQGVAVELCLVDNGNPPEVLTQLLDLAKTEPRLWIVSGYGNVGFSRGCNTGARLARGAYLLFLNPDSVLPPHALDALCRHAEHLPPHSMIGARLVDGQGRDQRGCRRALLTPGTALIEALRLGRLFPHLRLNYNDAPVPVVVTQMPAISGAFMFLRREDFWNIDGFDEGYFLHVEDLDLCLRFTRAGGTIYFAPDVIVTHMGGTSDATTAFVERHKARGFRRYFRRNFGGTFLPVLWLLDIGGWLRTEVKILLGKTRH